MTQYKQLTRFPFHLSRKNFINWLEKNPSCLHLRSGPINALAMYIHTMKRKTQSSVYMYKDCIAGTIFFENTNFNVPHTGWIKEILKRMDNKRAKSNYIKGSAIIKMLHLIQED